MTANMDKKTITERREELEVMTAELRKMLEQTLVPNKVWIEEVGIVTLWETKN